MYAERLSPNDRDEILHVLNQAFSNSTHTADFERNLPIMWTGEHDYSSRHIGVRENGRLVALLGVYPLPVKIAGHDLLFSTVGNVATLQEARGKGFMKLLMDAAMQELAAIGADASRLDGLRSRYNRFGYDHAGTTLHFTLTKRNAQKAASLPAYAFRPIVQKDTEAIAFARACQQRGSIHTLRPTQLDFYMTLRAWQHTPYLVLDRQGQPVGYLTASPDGKSIAEVGASPGTSAVELLRAYLLEHDLPSLAFTLPPWDTQAVRAAFEVCESWHIRPASMFKIISWDRIIGALLDLSLSLRPMPDGRARLGIQDFGTLEITVEHGRGCVIKTDRPAEISLDHRAATQLLFGPIAPASLLRLAPASPLAAWLPLPLSWNGQDRV